MEGDQICHVNPWESRPSFSVANHDDDTNLNKIHYFPKVSNLSMFSLKEEKTKCYLSCTFYQKVLQI